MNHEEFFVIDNITGAVPAPEVLAPSVPPTDYTITDSIFEHRIPEKVPPPVSPEAITEIYRVGLGILTNFVSGFDSRNAERMKIAASQLGQLQDQMYRAGSLISLANGKGLPVRVSE